MDALAQLPLDSYACVTAVVSSSTPGFEIADLVQAWVARGDVKGAWLHLQDAKALASYLGPALEIGFRIHSSSPTSVHLGHWLHKHSPNKLPPGPSHSVGVGGMVVNVKHRKVLYVKEKSGPAVGRWKVVTGLVDVGEDLCAAMSREVFEETGIRATMHHVVAFREMHASTFGSSNLFFMTLCTCDEVDEDKPLAKCENELEDAQWMSVDDAVAQSYYTPGTVYYELNRLATEEAKAYLDDHQPGRSVMAPKNLPHRNATMAVYLVTQAEPSAVKRRRQ